MNTARLLKIWSFFNIMHECVDGRTAWRYFLNGTYYKQKRPETRGLLTKFQGVKETKHWR